MYDHRLYTERQALQQKLCTLEPLNICNTDEVALLYMALPRRPVHDAECHSLYTLIKDRLTGVLNVNAGGRKGPLNITSQIKASCSFPRRLDPARNLELFYKAYDRA